jgi:hypothetical protein
MKTLALAMGSTTQMRDDMLRNKKRPWTDEDDQKLLALAATGRSRLSMAVAMKRSQGAVVSRLSALWLRKTERPTDTVKETGQKARQAAVPVAS